MEKEHAKQKHVSRRPCVGPFDSWCDGWSELNHSLTSLTSLIHKQISLNMYWFFNGLISYSRIFGMEQNRLFLLGNSCPCRQFAVHTVLHRYAHSSGNTHYVDSSKLGFTSTNHNPYICMAQMSSRYDYHHELEIWLLPQVSRPVQWSIHHLC